MAKKRKLPGEGYLYEFHGAYNSEAKAKAKAKRRKGWVIGRYPWGSQKKRFIVVTEKVPF